MDARWYGRRLAGRKQLKSACCRALLCPSAPGHANIFRGFDEPYLKKSYHFSAAFRRSSRNAIQQRRCARSRGLPVAATQLWSERARLRAHEDVDKRDRKSTRL